MDRTRGLPRIRARQRLSAVATCGARVSHRGEIPGVVVSESCSQLAERTARARTRGAPSSSIWPRSRLRSRGAWASRAHTSAATSRRATFSEILDRAEGVRADDWQGVRADDPVSGSRTSSTSSSPMPRPGCRRPRSTRAYLESKRTAADASWRAPRYRLQPAAAHRCVFEPTRRCYPAGRAFYEPSRTAAPARGQGCTRARAGRQGAALRLSGLRRLLAARHRVRLSRVAVREEPAQRPVRRHARRRCARSTTPSASGRRHTSG